MSAPNTVPVLNSIFQYPPNFPNGEVADTWKAYFQSVNDAINTAPGVLGAVSLVNLADHVSNSQGAALVGWNGGLSYPSNTIGNGLVTEIAARIAADTAIVANLADTSDPTNGAALIGMKGPFSGEVAKTQRDWNLMGFVSVFRFMSVAQIADIVSGTASIDVSSAIQSAINSVLRVYFPAGTYLVLSQIQLNNANYLLGDNWGGTIFKHTTDIRVFTSDGSTTSTAIYDVVLDGFQILSTVTGATTKYDIHLYNPNNCTIRNVRVKSGHNDAAYSSTNTGGIFLDKPAGSTATAFMNLIENCWIQNNSIFFNQITDSTIRGGWVWGHVRQFAIRIAGSSSGNISIEGVNGIISSQYAGGIWLDGANINQVRIVNCEHDGNPTLTRGDFIYSPQLTSNVLVTGCTVWGAGKNGLNITDPTGWTVTGNNFWQCNGSDGNYDDIRITGVTISPSQNVFSSNTHMMDVARTNKGYAYKEVNGGNPPINNKFVNAGITGAGYQAAKILSLGNTLITPDYIEGAWTPSLGAGWGGAGVLATGAKYIQIGNRIDFVVVVAGTGLTANGTTSTITLPATPARTTAAVVIRGDGTSGGVGYNFTDGKCYVQTQAATTQVTLNGTIFLV